MLIQRHVINIDALFIEYAQHYFAKTEPKAWEVIVQIEAKLNEKNIPRNMIGREKRVVALEQYLSQARNYDPVLDGLRSAVRYDKTYFRQDRRIAAAAAGESSPAARSRSSWPRTTPTWPTRARSSTGCRSSANAPSSMWAWMRCPMPRSPPRSATPCSPISCRSPGTSTSTGSTTACRDASAGARVPINVHADEFNELMGDEFIPLINKGGGAGLQVTAYTQTLSDIEARIGNRAKAGQVIGNFNNLFMLRVRETATAELLTRQLPKVEGLYDHHRLRRDRQLGHPRRDGLHVEHPGPHQHVQRADDRAIARRRPAQRASASRCCRAASSGKVAHAAAGARPRMK